MINLNIVKTFTYFFCNMGIIKKEIPTYTNGTTFDFIEYFARVSAKKMGSLFIGQIIIMPRTLNN